MRPCPFCRAAAIPRFEKRGIAIVDCERCGHRYADYEPPVNHVGDVYGDEYFGGGAGEYAGYDLEAPMLARRGVWYGRTLARYVQPGRLLEIGSASGAMLAGFRTAGWLASGIEPNATMAARARERGLDVATGTLEDVALPDSFDAIAFVQVLPHLYDIQAALARAAAATNAGGFWLIETWNRESVVARVLGPRWHEYNPPSVLHWFARSTLPKLLGPFGFEFVAGGRPPKSIAGAHARSLLEREGGGAAGVAARLVARAVPSGLEVPYPGDDVMWQAFRKR